MSVSDEDLRGAVDEVLEAAWPKERRRARRRSNLATLGRIAGGLLGFWGLSLMVHFVVGLSFPWVSYVCIGGMTIGAGIHEARNPDHLRER